MACRPLLSRGPRSLRRIVIDATTGLVSSPIGRNAFDLGLWWAAGDSNPEPED